MLCATARDAPRADLAHVVRSASILTIHHPADAESLDRDSFAVPAWTRPASLSQSLHIARRAEVVPQERILRERRPSVLLLSSLPYPSHTRVLLWRLPTPTGDTHELWRGQRSAPAYPADALSERNRWRFRTDWRLALVCCLSTHTPPARDSCKRHTHECPDGSATSVNMSIYHSSCSVRKSSPPFSCGCRARALRLCGSCLSPATIATRISTSPAACVMYKPIYELCISTLVS